MERYLDSWIVAGYFVGILIAGYFVARRQKHRAAGEFITGGRTFTWKQTGLTLLAFAVDPTYMGMAGVGFLWGMYLSQWIGVHIWFTSWVAAMFLVPIYWRTRIVTTPEYLEKRFNAKCRALFSVLVLDVYQGAFLLVTLKRVTGRGSFRPPIVEALGYGSSSGVVMDVRRTESGLPRFQRVLHRLETRLATD